jgi:hypothetical protein
MERPQIEEIIRKHELEPDDKLVSMIEHALLAEKRNLARQHYLLVHGGVLQLAKNALMLRFTRNGEQSCKEIVEEIDKTTLSLE